MAVPFRRTTSKKKKQRHAVSNLNFQKRATHILTKKCDNCQQIKKSHQICPACLTYRSVKY